MKSKEYSGLISRIIPRHPEINPTSAQEQVYVEIRAQLQPIEKEFHGRIEHILEAAKNGSVKRGLLRRNEYRFNATTEHLKMMAVKVETGSRDQIMRKFIIDGNTVIFDKDGKIQTIELGGLPEHKYNPSLLPMVNLVRGNVLGKDGLLVDVVMFEYHRMIISVASPVTMGVNICRQQQGPDKDPHNLVVGEDGRLTDPRGHAYFKSGIYYGGGFSKLAKDALRAVDIFKS